MRQLQPVIWAKGTFLTPQHLQLQDRFIESVLEFKLAALANDKYLFNTRMYLAISADLAEPELLRRVPQLVKLCSATHIETLIRQALPGMQMVHVPSPPGAIPVKLDYQYFSVNQSGVAWEAVQRARNIAAYVPGDIPNPQMELIIVLPQAE